jgi:hypothetical protein
VSEPATGKAAKYGEKEGFSWQDSYLVRIIFRGSQLSELHTSGTMPFVVFIFG